MKLEDLKKESPMIPDEIRSMIESEVKAQIANEENTDNGKVIHFRKSFTKAAAIALVATLAVGTTAFAAVKYFQWKVEQEGNYGTVITAEVSVDETEILARETKETDELAVGTKEVHVLSMKPEWLPEGMKELEWDKYSFESNWGKGGFSLHPLAILPSEDNSKPILERYVTSSEEIQVNGHEGVYVQKHGGNFDKIAYVAYPEYGWIIKCYVGKDTTKDQMMKFLENLNVVETEEIATSFEYFGEREIEETPANYKYDATAEEMKNLHQIGDTIEFEDLEWISATEAKSTPIQVTVKDVQLYDDFSALNPEYIDDDLQKALGEDGKLKKTRFVLSRREMELIPLIRKSIPSRLGKNSYT